MEIELVRGTGGRRELMVFGFEVTLRMATLPSLLVFCSSSRPSPPVRL